MGILYSQETYDERTARLAHSIAIAAALCAAFRQGTRWPYYLDYDDMNDRYEWSDWGRDAWRPGCALRGEP